MTLATYMTCLRLLATPCFILFYLLFSLNKELGNTYLWSQHVSRSIFFIAVASDFLDGFIARHFNQKSPLGAFLDPLADKFFLLITLLTCTLFPWDDCLDWWIFVIAFLRDFAIIGWLIFLKYKQCNLSMQPHWSGKLCTLCIMLTLSSFLFALPFLSIWSILTPLSCILSAFFYYKEAQKRLHLPLSPH